MLQVGELKATFAGLQLDVEAMFMQMPSVDLDELGSQLEAMQHHQQEQVSQLPVWMTFKYISLYAYVSNVALSEKKSGLQQGEHLMVKPHNAEACSTVARANTNSIACWD